MLPNHCPLSTMTDLSERINGLNEKTADRLNRLEEQSADFSERLDGLEEKMDGGTKPITTSLSRTLVRLMVSYEAVQDQSQI